MGNAARATLEESLERVEAFKSRYISGLPAGLSAGERTAFESSISLLMHGAELHVRACYEAGTPLGENLSGLTEHSGDEQYVYRLERLAKHLDDSSNQAERANDLIAEETAEGRELQLYVSMIAPEVRKT